jgi:hypothetical protein
LLNRKPRTLFVGGEEDLKGRIMGDLGEEGARSAQDQDRFVTSLLPKESGDLARRFGELAATATCVCAACGLPAKPSQSSPKAATRDLSFMFPPDWQD